MQSGLSGKRVLIAGTERGVRLVADVLGGHVEIVSARSVQEALRQLAAQDPFHCVVCNVRFDESRMFDFLHALRAFGLTPAPRVVCVRAAPPPLAPRARSAIEAALEALGVHAFVDFPAVAFAQGDAAAREVLRTAILRTRP